jgi:ATP-binding cassette subfamily C protein CydD/ATP-binding cassette subfamily C protein CydCD
MFVRRAPLAVLDEPTANVDAGTAGVLGEAIAQLGGERTVLVIAHAPDVVRCADRVVEVAGGRLIEGRKAVAAT